MDRLISGVAAAALAVVLTMVVATGAQAAHHKHKLSIDTVSNRADLISGGDVLVAIDGVHSTRGLKVTAAGKNWTKKFHAADGEVLGLVKKLPVGTSKIVAKKGRHKAWLAVTNHPIGGPVISGPQLQPWKCPAGSKDAQCDRKPEVDYLYKSTGSDGLQAYDPDNPPNDVATTTTDEGVKVPFIVRRETGYIDRDQYKIAALWQPGKPWKPTAPQEQFNGKVLITHGVSCGVDYQTGTAPDVTGGVAEEALGRGFATMSNALDYSGHNCNIAVQAESLMMTKEHLIDRLGPVRYTIGDGCSGGSLAAQWISNAYPGIYQGIVVSCSFPDAWSHRDPVPRLPPDARATSSTRRSGGRASSGIPSRWRTCRATSRSPTRRSATTPSSTS